MIDPPRPEAIAAVRALVSGYSGEDDRDHVNGNGDRPMMELNQTDEVPAFTGQELGRMNSQELACCRSGCGFARSHRNRNCAGRSPAI